MENTNLNGDDERIIRNITFAILLSLRRYLLDRQNNKINLAKEYQRFLSSQKRVSEAALTVNSSELAVDKGLSPEEINKKLARIFKREYDGFLKSSNLSKTLNLLQEDRIFKKIEGIDNIKREFPVSHTRGRSRSEKREGYPSKYKLTDKVKDYQRVLNNPDALNRINKELLSYDGTLIVFYRTAANDFFDLIIHDGNQPMYDFFNLSAHALGVKEVRNQYDWDLFRIELSKLTNEQRQKHVNEFVSFYTQNPQQLMFFIFALDPENMIKANVD